MTPRAPFSCTAKDAGWFTVTVSCGDMALVLTPGDQGGGGLGGGHGVSMGGTGVGVPQGCHKGARWPRGDMGGCLGSLGVQGDTGG